MRSSLIYHPTLRFYVTIREDMVEREIVDKDKQERGGLCANRG